MGVDDKKIDRHKSNEKKHSKKDKSNHIKIKKRLSCNRKLSSKNMEILM